MNPFSIFTKLRRVRRRRKRRASPQSRVHFLAHKAQALELATAKCAHFNTFYNFPYTKITIRDQKTRWGSCSRKGHLSFNYRIALLSEPLADYLVVHELCHLGQFNHSQKFWDLVAQTIPDYKSHRSELKKCRMEKGVVYFPHVKKNQHTKESITVAKDQEASRSKENTIRTQG